MSEQKDALGQAVALQYDGANAPKVTAKGEGLTAQQIIAIAKEHDIPLHEDPQLVQLLSQIDLGEEIPRNLYIAVAKVIAFAYMLTGKRPAGQETQSEVILKNERR